MTFLKSMNIDTAVWYPEHRSISIGLPLEEKTFNAKHTRIIKIPREMLEDIIREYKSAVIDGLHVWRVV